MKITDDFRYKWKPSCAYHKIKIFVTSKDEWDTEEDTGKSMKNALHVHKGKIKPVTLAIVELCESEGIRQAGRQAGR